MARAGESLFDRVLCVIGAVAFSQLPEFIQQYLQRLGGRLDEARRQVQIFEQTAAQSKLTLVQFIERTSSNADTAVARLAGVMRGAVERVDDLAAADAAIRNASLWAKPFVFLSRLDLEIASATWAIYRPAVPTTVEGALYAGLGVLAILGLYHGCVRFPISTATRRWVERRRVKQAAAGEAAQPARTK